MKVKMLTTAAGPDGVWMAGQVVDVPDATAKALVAGGYAEALETKKVNEIETATAEPPENTMKKPPKRRKKGK